MSPTSLKSSLSVFVTWRLQVSDHSCVSCILDHNWFPNYLLCHKVLQVHPGVKLRFKARTIKLFLFSRWKWGKTLHRHPFCMVKLIGHIQGTRTETHLTGGGLAHASDFRLFVNWSILSPHYCYPTTNTVFIWLGFSGNNHWQRYL